MKNDQAKISRKITKAEKYIARRTHLIIIPALLFLTILYFILTNIDLPPFALKASKVFGVLFVLILIFRALQLEYELSNSMIEEFRGTVTEKRSFGRRRSSSGSRGNTGPTSRKPTNFVIQIDGENFRVKSKMYSKVKVGDKIEMIHLPKSQVILKITNL
jgi:uncharacterized membrane protein YwzB